MTTLDEVGELWCALWMKELARGATPREYGHWEPEVITPEMTIWRRNWLTLTFVVELYEGDWYYMLNLEDEDGVMNIPDFTIFVFNEDGLESDTMAGSIKTTGALTAANPWDAAAEKLRELVEAA